MCHSLFDSIFLLACRQKKNLIIIMLLLLLEGGKWGVAYLHLFTLKKRPSPTPVRLSSNQLFYWAKFAFNAKKIPFSLCSN